MSLCYNHCQHQQTRDRLRAAISWIHIAFPLVEANELGLGLGSWTIDCSNWGGPASRTRRMRRTGIQILIFVSDPTSLRHEDENSDTKFESLQTDCRVAGGILTLRLPRIPA
jgi:hypothetical protein